MDKPNHAYISVSEEYRKLREIQTYINRLVWSTELCYSYFLKNFENETALYEQSTAEIFANLPIQAWFKNRKGTGKYNLTLKEHNEVVRDNQLYICRSAMILYNSYFDDYLKYRIDENCHFLLLLNLNNNAFKASSLKVNLINLLKADCCRKLRNMIVHEPTITFLPIKETREEVKSYILSHFNREPKKKQSFLLREGYTFNYIKECLDKAINEVIDSAIKEVEDAAIRNVSLPYEFFFMLYTFTNYNTIAAEIEQVLFFDNHPKTFYNRVHRESIDKDRQVMITDPAVIGRVYNVQSNEPIKLAKVQVVDNVFFGLTDQNGNYYLSPNLKDGSHEIQVSAEGYQTKLEKIITTRGTTVTFNVGLQLN